MIHNSILDTIGRTPVVRIQRLAPTHVTMYVKCEFFNPLASVKDRLAIAIIEHAESTGALAPGQTVVEATSGNTGIALAMVCAAKGYPFVATMVETFSIERRKIMRILGAKVILTPAAERGTGMVRKAEELAKKHGWFLARQFENEANPAYHRNTTGPEILSDFAGKRLDYFVTGWGTGGTLTGAGQMIRLARPDVQIIATEPAGAALLSGEPFAPHKIQGWTPDFVPAVLDRTVPHRVLPVTDAEAIARQRGRSRAPRAFFAASPPAAPSPRRARSPTRRLKARSFSPCCRTRGSAIYPRRCSRGSPKAAIRSRDSGRRFVHAAAAAVGKGTYEMGRLVGLPDDRVGDDSEGRRLREHQLRPARHGRRHRADQGSGAAVPIAVLWGVIQQATTGPVARPDRAVAVDDKDDRYLRAHGSPGNAT